MTSSLRVWLTAIVCSLGLFTACGSGGGGGGGGSTPPVDPPATGLNPSLDSLFPATPAVGATLIPDAATLRPFINGGAYTYRGTSGAAATKYVTTTTQAVPGGNITETASNAANAGARTAPVSVVSTGPITNTQSIDFAGKGVKQNINFVELQSPVRENDQYRILLQRYAAADTSSGNVLDVAIYARVIGKEVVSLPNLPALNAIRVDTVTLQRVTRASDGVPSPATTSTVSTWYAQGIGIVRQTTSNGTATSDEKLVSWDGVTIGFGAMAPQAATLAGGATLPGPSSSGLRGAVAFDSYGLVFTDAGTADTAVSKIDNRGKVTASGLVAGLRLTASSRVVIAGSNVLVLRQLSGADINKLGLTRLDANGALVGAIDGVKLDATAGRTGSTLGSFETASDDAQLWLMWTRANVATTTIPANELILRSFLVSNGAAESPEVSLDPVAASNLRMTLGGKVAQSAWTQAGGQVLTSAISYTATAGTPLVKKSISIGGPTTVFAPVRFGTTGALLWPVTTGTVGTAGLQLNADFALVGTTGSTDNNTELLGGVVSGAGAVPAFTASSPRPVSVGTRLAVASQGSGDLWPGEVNAAIVPGTVSWLDAPPNQAAGQSTNSLAKQTAATVRFAWDAPFATPLIFGDRVLLLTGGNALSSTVVWMNRGP
jgi:hypothetical protein